MLRRLPAALLLLTTTLGLALGASIAQGPPSAAGQQPRFRHEQHVSKSWSSKAAKEKGLAGRDGEFKRDCLGCHNYSNEASAKPAKPTDRCDRCHDPDGYWKQTTGQTVDTSKAQVDPAKESKSLFKHSSHVEYRRDSANHKQGEHIDCAYCHYEDAGTKSTPAFRIKIPGENSENKSYCTACHNDPSLADRDSFNEGLTEAAQRRADDKKNRGPPVFSHAAHLSPEKLKGGNLDDCKLCHTSLKDSKPESLAETQFDTNACTQCHNGLKFASSGKTDKGERVTVTSPTAGVFSHAQHLASGSSNVAVKPVGDEGCLRCHVFEATATRAEGVRTFTLKPFLQPAPGKSVFKDGCGACHTDLERKVPNHGNTDECAQCHVVQEKSLTSESKMQSNRPLDAIARVDPASFTFERQSHKFISKGLTQDAPASCSECHKAKLEMQPSHIEKKPFSHATHLRVGFEQLPLADKTAACATCHGEVAKSDTLKEVKLAYDTGACVVCHGKDGATTTPEPSSRSEMFRFDHKQHVGAKNRDGKPVSCVDCHLTSRPDQKLEITLADKVADCTLCHGHFDKPEGRVNRFASESVKSCATCHAGGVPAKGMPVSVGRARLVADGSGYQEHKGKANCDTCHQILPEAFDDNSRQKAQQRVIEIAVRAEGKLGTPHEGRIALRTAPNATGEQKEMLQYFWNDVACIDCHWHSTELVNNFGSVIGNAAKGSKLERVKTLLSTKGWQYTYRAKEGNFLGGPDTEYPSGFPGLVPAKPK